MAAATEAAGPLRGPRPTALRLLLGAGVITTVARASRHQSRHLRLPPSHGASQGEWPQHPDFIKTAAGSSPQVGSAQAHEKTSLALAAGTTAPRQPLRPAEHRQHLPTAAMAPGGRLASLMHWPLQ